MAKYDPLRNRLQGRTEQTVTMSLDEIDALVSLPASAHLYAEWWSNEDVATTSHVQCKAWQAAGYEASPNRTAGTVTFRRRR
jgi:hypothetical protein